MTALPFDTVTIAQGGRTVRLTAEEFLALPFATRVELILARLVLFSDGSKPVDRQLALQRLRQLKQTSNAAHESPAPATAKLAERAVAPAACFHVDTTTHKGVIHVRLRGAISAPEMQAFVAALDAAVEAFEDEPYHVFCDSRELQPMSPEVATLFELAEAHSAAQPNFRGSAVLSHSSVVSMQQRRTSFATGVADTELVSDDEDACWAHIARVQRRAKT